MAGGNYIKIREPQQLPPVIDTGKGIAELAKAGVNGGFDQGPEVDFLDGIVYSSREKRDLFEKLGFKFFVADFDYKTPGTLPIYGGTINPENKTINLE